jgi:hypothetical protein
MLITDSGDAIRDHAVRAPTLKSDRAVTEKSLRSRNPAGGSPCCWSFCAASASVGENALIDEGVVLYPAL